MDIEIRQTYDLGRYKDDMFVKHVCARSGGPIFAQLLALPQQGRLVVDLFGIEVLPILPGKTSMYTFIITKSQKTKRSSMK